MAHSELRHATSDRAALSSRTELRYSIRVAEGVYLVRTLFANVALISSEGDTTVGAFDGSRQATSRRRWVLVDAGLRGYADSIERAAEECFGPDAMPEAIVLTHGHFDHVGSLKALLQRWQVPVYAHVQEMPHLTGRLDYPPPDPLAGGGMMAWSSRLLPKGAIDISDNLLALPQDRSVPGAPGWEWIHTPGHTEGHISLFRAEGRVLIAGDAVTTTKQESLIAVATQRPGVYGPPAYFTTDWDAARESAWRLANLQPEVLATGHGVPLRGAAMRHQLHIVASHFDERERPKFGRYARTPAVMQNGSYNLPRDPLPWIVGGAALVAAAALGVRRRTNATQDAISEVDDFERRRNTRTLAGATWGRS
jgi:glyoxylase-like metal-dependent hydrolase (beta-lactamase superfamily II)